MHMKFRILNTEAILSPSITLFIPNSYSILTNEWHHNPGRNSLELPFIPEFRQQVMSTLLTKKLSKLPLSGNHRCLPAANFHHLMFGLSPQALSSLLTGLVVFSSPHVWAFAAGSEQPPHWAHCLFCAAVAVIALTCKSNHIIFLPTAPAGPCTIFSAYIYRPISYHFLPPLEVTISVKPN